MTCDTPYYVDNPTPADLRGAKIPVPCGRCPVCKRRRIDSWVFRLEQEERISSSCYFITLTYDTWSVPISANGFMTLKKRDYQLFMKRLRKLDKGSKLRYYACGEYGEKRMRPHYHAILFNLSDVDFIVDAWQVDGRPIGKVHSAVANKDTMGYTVGYINKGNKIPVHSKDDRVKEFSLMSKGLGKNYLSKAMVSYHKNDISRMFVTRKDGLKQAIPRYYRNKIYTEQEMKAQVKLVQQRMEDKGEKLRGLYESIYGRGNEEFTFEDWLDSARFGRYNRSQKNNKIKRRKEL